jgi:hypothetical protein
MRGHLVKHSLRRFPPNPLRQFVPQVHTTVLRGDHRQVVRVERLRWIIGDPGQDISSGFGSGVGRR